MADDSEGKRKLEAIQADLATNGLSRRELLERLGAAGIGFGAAYVFGLSEANAKPAGGVTRATVTSTDPALERIIEDNRAQADNAGEIAPDMKAYFRFYPRFYPRYHRIYPRYFRIYPRYFRYGRYRRFFR